MRQYLQFRLKQQRQLPSDLLIFKVLLLAEEYWIGHRLIFIGIIL